jgi:hypothetical protein
MWVLLALLIAALIPATSRLADGAPAPTTSPTPAAESPAPTAESPAPAAESPSPVAPATRSPGPSADERADNVSNAAQAMGSIQAYLEFYFMETGQYPEALEDMLSQYNQGVKQSEPLVKIPTDPVTGKKFVYTTNGDRNRYTLRVPEPAAYGLASLEVHQVDWGWMAGIASEQKKKRMTARCAQYMSLIADVLDQYNKANRNKYPDSLQQMIPKYLQKVPTCPLCKQPYVYTHTDRGFEISCPDPKAHGLEYLKFSSTDGLKHLP